MRGDLIETYKMPRERGSVKVDVFPLVGDF